MKPKWSDNVSGGSFDGRSPQPSCTICQAEVYVGHTQITHNCNGQLIAARDKRIEELESVLRDAGAYILFDPPYEGDLKEQMLARIKAALSPSPPDTPDA